MTPFRAILALIGLIPAAVLAGDIGAETAFQRLSGNTFACQKNSRGELCWFFQSADGTFKAKFESADGTTKHYDGSWFIRGDDRVCWDWNGGQTHCYVGFEVGGKSFDLVRDDDVIHAGSIEPGNSQGL